MTTLPRTKELIEGSPDPGKPYQTLILILDAVEELLLLPDNDFCWTYWHDGSEATTQVAGLRNRLMATKQLSRIDMDVLFAPTGPLQEVSLQSGWSEIFLKVAARYDQVAQLIWPEV